MNYLYLNTPLQQPVPRSFVFSKRNERIDWRRVAAVDVERVARDLDFQVLQDNIEQIALCNIDMEVDSRAMDPNFIKLYKMSQLIIEYLLLCQDQLTSQLVDYEQIKGKSVTDHDESRRQIDKLRNELNDTKKESKRRKKLIETQQKMLMAHQTAHHACPVCSHTFLTVDYLQAHITRRHPEFDPNRKRERDVDVEKENQRLKDELNNKDKELQTIKAEKTVADGTIRVRDENIRRLEEDIDSLRTKLKTLDEKYFELRSSTQNQTPSPHRREGGVKELLKENKGLRTENEQLKQSLQQAESNFKKEQKSKRRIERERENLQREITNLNETLRSLQNGSGDTSRLSEELITYRNRYNEEKNRRKKLEDDLNEANNQLAQFRNQPPPVIDRKSPVPPPRSSSPPPRPRSPPPAPIPVPIRPIDTTEIFLPQYCPSLIRHVNGNPRYLNRFRTDAKKLYVDEFNQYEDLNIDEKDTRLSNNDFQAKMAIVQQTRQNMQNDLPNFERIRDELSRTVDRLAHERMNAQHSSGASVRASGGKLVTFVDQSQGQQTSSTTKRPTTATTTITTVQSKPKQSSMNYVSDDESTKTNSSASPKDHRPQPTRTGILTEIQPQPRKTTPAAGVNALAAGSMRPTSAVTNTKTISAIVRPSSTMKKYEGESDTDSSPEESNVATKVRNLDQQLSDISSRGQKPTTNAVPQGFQVSHKRFPTQGGNNDDDDDDDSESTFTSVHDTTTQRKPSTGHPPHISGRDITNNPHLSSGEMSQYTYDSLLKSPVGKGPDLRRPPTADSAKTSNVDSDDDFEEDD